MEKLRKDMNIPDQFIGSPALQLVQSRGWTFEVNGCNIRLHECPYCGKHSHPAFVMEIHGAIEDSDLRKRDGMHICHRCGQQGTLRGLKEHLGISIPGVVSTPSYQKQIDLMLDVESFHQALLEDADAMDYLMNGRGFSRDIIVRQKIGLTKKWFRSCGEVRAIVYPYLVNGNCVFWHYRTLPTMPLSKSKVPKDFTAPSGWEATLYNSGVLQEGLKDLVIVEGEANCIAAMDKGIDNICGVPGASAKKADWIRTLDSISTLERIYLCYDPDSAGRKNQQEMASRIGVERCWKIKLPYFMVTTDEQETRPGKDLNEWFAFGGGTAEAFEKLKQEASQCDVAGVASPEDVLQQLEEQINNKGLEPKYKTGWSTLNKLVGFEEGDVIDIVAPEKIGKLQSVNSPVLLYSGEWCRIGDLKIGDHLASVDGKPSEVVGIFPQGVKELFEITFSDGRKTIAGREHLWKVCHINEPEQWRVYTTDAIISEYSRNQRGHGIRQELYIPLIDGDFGRTDPLPIHPWVLGVIIGNGSIIGNIPHISSADVEIIDRLNNLGIATNHIANYNYSLSHTGLNDHLESIGLICDSSKKFIPTEYLKASKESRWELLRGLLDIDGTVINKNGTISYRTESEQLAKDVVYLVRSLGGIVYLSVVTDFFASRIGKFVWILTLHLPNREKAFTLSRKLEMISSNSHQPRLKIINIRQVESDEAVCIAVSHPSKLYITDDFIVTHNTTVGMNLLEHMVNTYGEDGIIICLEMTTDRVARKWVCHVTGFPDNIPKTPEESIKMKDEFLKNLPFARNRAMNREGRLYFCYPIYKSADDIYNLIRDCIRRYGVKWVMLDNLQRLCDSTLGGKNRTVHLSEISKKTSQIAKDYNIQMVRILQPHRIKDGAMVTTDDVDGASQIAKDCDCMITLHRNRIGEMSANDFQSMGYIETESAFDEKMLVTVGLSRYSAGGYTTFQYDGARSTVYEYDVAKIAAIKTEASKTVGHNYQLEALGLATTKPEVSAAQSADITI